MRLHVSNVLVEQSKKKTETQIAQIAEEILFFFFKKRKDWNVKLEQGKLIKPEPDDADMLAQR